LAVVEVTSTPVDGTVALIAVKVVPSTEASKTRVPVQVPVTRMPHVPEACVLIETFCVEVIAPVAVRSVPAATVTGIDCWLGERTTTREGSVAAGAVEAALTAAVLVPSVIFWKPARAATSNVGAVLVPSVSLTNHPDAAVPAAPCATRALRFEAVAWVTVLVQVPLWVTAPMTLAPVGIGEFGERATTRDGSVATAAVEAGFSLKPTRFVPSNPPMYVADEGGAEPVEPTEALTAVTEPLMGMAVPPETP
jgi:hypothetical protein